jgi:hypothetical protein
MSSRFVKITCAAALALPLAAVAMPSAHAETFPGENDCNRHFSGAVTQNPHTSDPCYGIDQRIHRDRPSNDVYRGTTIVVLGGQGAVSCNRGDLLYGIFYSTTNNPEQFLDVVTLAGVTGVTVSDYQGNGVPNSASGNLSSGIDGTTVTAACRDIA